MTRHNAASPQFYLTAPSPCPYLPDRYERKVFTHLVGDSAPMLNDVLTQGGFRRSQNIAYRPACEGCRACVSVRVRVRDFERTRSMRRQWRAGADLVGEVKAPCATSEQYALFRLYLDKRHHAGGMSDMSMLDYTLMVEDTHVNTMLIEYRRRGPDTYLTGRGAGPLAAVALTDRMTDGLSMVYSFFDPDMRTPSLGTYLILDHIERARCEGLHYVYLGFWVEGSSKMDYKARFRPQEFLAAHGWQLADWER